MHDPVVRERHAQHVELDLDVIAVAQAALAASTSGGGGSITPASRSMALQR
jgi:hypothetical protein